MSASATAAFEKKYSDDVTHLAQQKKSVLMDQTRVHRNVRGSTYDFHRMATVAAVLRAPGDSSDVTGLNPISSVVTATLADYEVPVYVQKFDVLKTSVDLEKEYQRTTVNSINRRIDQSIIAALAAAPTSTPTATGGLTMAKILEAVTMFNTNDVDPEDRILLLSPKAMSEALAITQLTSADYLAVQAIASAKIGTAFGMKWLVSSQLPLATVNRTAFAYNKQAVGVAFGEDIKTRVDWVAQKSSHLINTTVSLGAVVIDPSAVFKINLVE